MLVVSHSAGFGTLSTLSDDLVTLKKNVDRCVKAFPLGSSNTEADISVTCDMQVGGVLSKDDGIRPFEKLTLLEDADNQLMFEIARTILANWRLTNSGPAKSSSEDGVRRIAASKLGEPAVFDSVSPTLAVQSLSSAGRIESADEVKLKIAEGLGTILRTRDIPASVNTEAKTTLGILADPFTQSDPFVLNAARDALKALTPKPVPLPPVAVTPVPATPVPKQRSKWTIPIIASIATAAVAGGVLLYIFKRQPSTANLSSAGPLRRRVEGQLRRRRSR
jgi:hypothetical protein